MKIKRVVCPERLRRIPRQFSWVDQRLIRDNRIAGCDHSALALYLFLVTVADFQGLSYYSDASISRWLRMEASVLGEARRQLQVTGLVAYDKPIYQVLGLDPVASEIHGRQRGGSAGFTSLGEIMRRVMEAKP